MRAALTFEPSNLRRAPQCRRAIPHYPGVPMKLGAHMSVAGGSHKALERGKDVGCTVVQIFSKNANQWAAKPISPEDAQLFMKTRDDLGYVAGDLIVHDSYLIN